MAAIVMTLTIKINQESTIPVVILSEFGKYSSETLETAEAALHWGSKKSPELDWNHGKVLYLWYDQTGPKPPERVDLPCGGEAVFFDMRLPDVPETLKDYVQCMDIGRDALLAGHTPEYAAADAWEYAKKHPTMNRCTAGSGSFASWVDSMKNIQDDTHLKKTDND